MTTDTSRLGRTLRVLALGIAIAGSLGACGGTMRRPDGLDVATVPEPLRHAYGVFEVRCSRCHSLARPLNADIDDPAYWEDYVRRMRRQPGSGISRADASEILLFLRHYTAERVRRDREEHAEPTPAPSAQGSSPGPSTQPSTTPGSTETAPEATHTAPTPATPAAASPPKSGPARGEARTLVSPTATTAVRSTRDPA